MGGNSEEEESSWAKFEAEGAGRGGSVSPDLLSILREFSVFRDAF